MRQAVAARLADLAKREPCDEDAEWLLKDFRYPGLDATLRLQASLALARLLERRGKNVARAEIMEFKTEVGRSKELLLLHPGVSLELAEACEKAPSLLADLADAIYNTLVEHVLAEQGSLRAVCQYMLVDLAEREAKLGRLDTARLLWGIAKEAPVKDRDPRAGGRRLPWRFDSEFGVPQDAYRIQLPNSLLDADVRVMRPLGGAIRRCTCSCRPVQRQAIRQQRAALLSGNEEEAAENAVAEKTPMARTIRFAEDVHEHGCGATVVDREAGTGAAPGGDDDSPPARPAPSEATDRPARRFRVRLVDRDEEPTPFCEVVDPATNSGTELEQFGVDADTPVSQ